MRSRRVGFEYPRQFIVRRRPCEHEGHGVVDGNLIDAEAVVEGEGKFGAKPESVVGKKSDGASPEKDVSVDKRMSAVPDKVN